MPNAMSSWLRGILRRLGGERRRVHRPDAEKVQVVNRQYAVAEKLAHRTGTTPEALMDYHRADGILGRQR
jgi:hypothetical protein